MISFHQVQFKSVLNMLIEICMYRENNLYTPNFDSITSAQTEALGAKYLLTLADSKPSSNLSDVNLLENAEDQLNDTDRELLNLLAAEEDCSDILQNIASNENFENLINEGAAFEQETVMEDYANTSMASEITKEISYQTVEKQKKVGKFKCDQCDKMCTTKKLLKYHLMTHFGIREHSCEICGKTFKHKYEVTVHKLTHGKPMFQCDICSKMFIHKSHLTCHRRKHTGDYVAYCKDCSKGFVTQASYRNHINTHHNKLLHICDVCGIQLSSISSLKEHLTTHESSERSYVCDMCGKTYLNSRSLRSHMKTHTHVKNFVCNICGKALSGKKILETHLKTHIGDKSYICEFCNKGFASNQYLIVHHRTHTGDRPFKCSTCGKCFTQRTSLTVHIRSHTGERPYKCHCGKSFITKTHLVAHSKTHEIAGIDFVYVPQDIQ